MIRTLSDPVRPQPVPDIAVVRCERTGLNTAMPSPRTLLRALMVLALAAVMMPAPRPAAALDAATFVSRTAAWAQAEEREYGVPASVAIAQAMLESVMGESGLTKNANN